MKLPALDVNMLFLGATVGDIMSELVLKHYDKDSEKDGKSMAELEKPVKGIEWLREFRLKEEKMYDPGQEILVEEERQERKKSQYFKFRLNWTCSC